MRVLYLLDRPELGGGVKVVFQHAALLAARGHGVTVAGRGAEPPWVAPLAAAMAGPGIPLRYLDVSDLPPGEPPRLAEAVDLAVATYWTTLGPVRRSGARAAVHLCQGYEPDWPHQRHRAAEIEAAYREAGLPAWVVAPHLGELLAQRHGLPWRVTPPPVDPRFRPALRFRPRRRPWVAVQGIFEAEVKGVPTALEAVGRLEALGLRPRLLRVSVLPPGDAEAAQRRADRHLYGVPPRDVAAALRRCDLTLFPARPGEGFGLPLLEALASGVPAVASRLPSTEFMAGGAVPLVEPGDAGALAREAAHLLGSPPAWRRARRAGKLAARRFAPPAVADALEDALRWALEAGVGPRGEA